MKIKVAQARLAEGIAQVKGGEDAKPSVAILETYRLKAEGGELTITASDLYTEVSAKVECEIIEEGEACINGRMISSMVNAIPDGEVEIATGGSEAKIAGGGCRYSIKIDDSSPFPAIPAVDGGDKIGASVDAAALKSMIRMTSYAASADESKRCLKGVLFEFGKNVLTLVATDGRRLALTEIKTANEVEKRITIPNKAIKLIANLLNKYSEDQVVLIADDKMARLESAKWKLTTRIIEEAYPNYRMVIPKEQPRRAVVGREEFVEKLRQAKVTSLDENNSVRITFDGGTMTIESGFDMAHTKVEMAVKYDGEKTLTYMNPDYLIQAIDCLDEDEITIEFADTSPWKITSSVQYLHVLMPLRIR